MDNYKIVAIYPDTTRSGKKMHTARTAEGKTLTVWQDSIVKDIQDQIAAGGGTADMALEVHEGNGFSTVRATANVAAEPYRGGGGGGNGRPSGGQGGGNRSGGGTWQPRDETPVTVGAAMNQAVSYLTTAMKVSGQALSEDEFVNKAQGLAVRLAKAAFYTVKVVKGEAPPREQATPTPPPAPAAPPAEEPF